MDEIIALYYNQYNMIDEMFSDIIMEATNDTDVNKSEFDTGINTLKNFSDKISEKAERIFEMIKSIVQKCIDKVTILINNALVTDKGFIKEMGRCIKSYKPKQNITIINYNYNTGYLDQFSNRFKNEFRKLKIDFNKNIEAIPNDSLLRMNTEQLNEYFVNIFNLPSNIKNLNSAYFFIKTKFRGNKTEQTLNASDLTNAIKAVRNYRSYQNNLNEDMKICYDITRDIRYKLRNLKLANNDNEINKKQIINMLRNISRMFNVYTTFIHSLYTLKLEYYFNNRIIVKKFYNMKI